MGNWTRRELKTQAKAILKTYYWKLVLVGFFLFILTGQAVGAGRHGNGRSGQGNGAASRLGSAGISTAMLARVVMVFGIFLLIGLVVGLILRIFLVNPLVVGCQGFFARSIVQEPELSDVLGAFRGNYMNVVKTAFLKDLFIGLWSLLFVIPGVIKSYEYRMVPYLLAEDPYMDSNAALAESKAMMDGNKWNAFVLDLSFIGWAILSGITLGILQIFWVGPYIYLTDAALYQALQGSAPGQGVEGGYNTYS